jgi:hypothetical protein
MRKLTCGLVFVMTVVAMAPVLNAQEPVTCPQVWYHSLC